MLSQGSENKAVISAREAFSAMAEAQEREQHEKTMTLDEREAERRRKFDEEYGWSGFELRRKPEDEERRGPVQVDENEFATFPTTDITEADFIESLAELEHIY
jgi:hypothetical protein